MTADDSSASTDPRERRLHLRAYHYWRSLLDGRHLPSIADMQPGEIADFRDRSFLIDFPQGYGRPMLRFVGHHIHEEHGGEPLIGRTAVEVSQDSVLSRLTVHYMEVLAHKSPIGFEAGYDKRSGERILYRGILLPFSDDDENVHFILGVVNWKVDRPVAIDTSADRAEDTPAAAPSASPRPAAESPAADVEIGQADDSSAEAASPFGDLLQEGQKTAGALAGNNPRSREALYDLLQQAFEIHERAQRSPAEFSAALKSANIRAQARAPFTPILKLLLGRGYDKTRLTEYASALALAQRFGATPGSVKEFIRNHPGGIKGCVKEERRARRIERGQLGQGVGERARRAIRSKRTLARVSLPAQVPDEEFFLLLARRGVGEREVEILAALEEKDRVVEPILRRAAKSDER